MKRLLCLLFVLAIGAEARDRGGSTAGSALLTGDFGARPAALGGAYTSIAEGPAAIRYNAAGLTGDGRHRFFAEYSPSFLDINRTNLAYSRALWGGGAAVSFSMIDYGSITRTTIANKTGAGTFDAADYLIRFGYGREISDRIRLGSTIGWYHFEIDNVEANGVTADLSLLYQTAISGLQFGAAVRNIGSRVQFDRDREELPLSFGLGGSYRPSSKWLVSADYEIARGNEGAIKAGVEYAPVDAFALRVGYDGRNEVGSGLTAGAGFRTGNLGIDYAYVPFGDLGEVHRISLGWSFGEAASLREEPVRTVGAGSAAPAPTRPNPTRVRMVEKNPTLVDLSELRENGRRAFEQGRHADAIEFYARALQFAPNDETLRYNLATSYFRSGDFQTAADLYRVVTLHVPNDAEVWLYLGYAEYKSGRTDAARRAWNEVLRISPNNALARQALQVAAL